MGLDDELAIQLEDSLQEAGYPLLEGASLLQMGALLEEYPLLEAGPMTLEYDMLLDGYGYGVMDGTMLLDDIQP